MESVTDYKPGTVADATVCGVPNQRVFRHVVDGVGRWQTEGHLTHFGDDVTDIRPLVVLDLGDAEELAAAVRSLREAGENSRYHVEGYSFTFAIADQIEDQIKPPRIPEPGLWAVVEAKLPNSGQSRLRVIRVGKREWQPVSYNYSNPLAWGDLIDPTLIREGIQS